MLSVAESFLNTHCLGSCSEACERKGTGKIMHIGLYYYKKLRVDRLIFINLSQCCAYSRLERLSTSLEKSLKLSLAVFSNVFATLVLSLENSTALSLACCIEFFHASILANM